MAVPRALFYVVVITLSACSGAPPEASLPQPLASVPARELCPPGGPGPRCLALVRADVAPSFSPEATSGLGPAALADAYKLDTTRDPGVTVGVVVFGGFSTAESDLACYRDQYKMPPCTKANGCLRMVNQDGEDTQPADPSDPNWKTEAALDVDMISATCPHCKLLIVQVDEKGPDDGIFRAQATAARLGATVISNSWALAEGNGGQPSELEHFFTPPDGTTIFVATGDWGYNGGEGKAKGPSYPSTSAHVISVGGTSLVKSMDSPRGWTETAWAGAGSSCSGSIPKPSYQGDTNCDKRAAADVAAVADLATGVAMCHNNKWQLIGGTSVATPIVAGIFALTGHAGATPDFPYRNSGAFFDVEKGANGNCGNVLCTAGPGWDGPTGVGTPNGAVLTGGGVPPKGDMQGPPPSDMGAPTDGGRPPADGGHATDAGTPDGGANGTDGGGTGGNQPSPPSSGCNMAGAGSPAPLFILLAALGMLLPRRRRP